MRFFHTLAVAALAAVASANSKANPFNIPTDGYTFKVGEPTALSWKPTTGSTVSLYLKWGAVTTKGSGTTIASGIDNDGSYTWNVPSNLAAQPDYTIQIVSDDDEDDYNFIGRFTVEGSTVSVSSTASSTSTTSASTESSTATQTTETTSTSTPSTSTSSSSPTTMTTASSTSVTETSTESSSTAVSTSASASTSPSASASPSETSQIAVPTTNAGVANRVSGGMLALIAGAFLL